MVNREEIFITSFETGKNAPQHFFDYIIETVLRYKFKFSLPINGKIITEAIFSLTRKDKLPFKQKLIDGQKIKELFVVSIYLKYIDDQHPGKVVIVSMPQEELSYDVAIYVVSSDDCQMDIKNKKFKILPNKNKLNKNARQYLIQVKEEYDFKEAKDAVGKFKRIDQKSINKKIANYDELVLIFNRKYVHFFSDDFNSILKENKKVGLIILPGEKEMKVEYPDKEITVKFEDGKYHFLLATSGLMQHIKFDIPKCLSKNPILGG